LRASRISRTSLQKGRRQTRCPEGKKRNQTWPARSHFYWMHGDVASIAGDISSVSICGSARAGGAGFPLFSPGLGLPNRHLLEQVESRRAHTCYKFTNASRAAATEDENVLATAARGLCGHALHRNLEPATTEHMHTGPAPVPLQPRYAMTYMSMIGPCKARTAPRIESFAARHSDGITRYSPTL
jgi:hypothetical protein